MRRPPRICDMAFWISFFQSHVLPGRQLMAAGNPDSAAAAEPRRPWCMANHGAGPWPQRNAMGYCRTPSVGEVAGEEVDGPRMLAGSASSLAHAAFIFWESAT